MLNSDSRSREKSQEKNKHELDATDVNEKNIDGAHQNLAQLISWITDIKAAYQI